MLIELNSRGTTAQPQDEITSVTMILREGALAFCKRLDIADFVTIMAAFYAPSFHDARPFFATT